MNGGMTIIFPTGTRFIGIFKNDNYVKNSTLVFPNGITTGKCLSGDCVAARELLHLMMAAGTQVVLKEVECTAVVISFPLVLALTCENTLMGNVMARGPIYSLPV